MSRKLLISMVVISLTTMSAHPANAISLPRPIRGVADRVINRASEYLNHALDKYLGKELDKVLDGAMGALGLPDPIKAGEKIEEQVSQGAKKEPMAVNGKVQGNLARQEFEGQYGRAVAGSVLGDKGQQQQAEVSQQTSQSVAAVEKAAQAAQGSNVTQDVMKQISAQNQQLAKIQQAIQGETQETTRQVAGANLQLGTISSTMTEQERAKAMEASANGNSFLRQAAFSGRLWEDGL